MRQYYVAILLLGALLAPSTLSAQADRFDEIDRRLKQLATTTVSGLNEQVDFGVSGVSIQEFLRALAESNNLNISVDPRLDIRIVNNFTNEEVINVISFLCREYDLDIRFVGSIMSFSKHETPAPPPPPEPLPKIIEITYDPVTDLMGMNLTGDKLGEVAKRITQVTKKNVIVPSKLGDKAVTSYIEGMPFAQALEKMAYVNGYTMTITPDSFYLVEEPKEELSLLSAKSKTPKKEYTLELKSGDIDLSFSGDTMGEGKLITLEAVGIPISDLIKLISQELGINYFLFSEPAGKTTLSVDKVTYQQFLNHLLRGTQHTYRIERGIYLIGDRRLEGLRSVKVYQFQHRSLDEMLPLIPSELRAGVEIKELREMNSIILSGSAPNITEINAFLLSLDKVVPMILIEIVIVDVRKSRTTSTGIRAGLGSDSAAQTLLPGIDFGVSSQSLNDALSRLSANSPINLGRVSPSFYLTLSAIEASSNAEVRQVPKLATLNGHDANFSTGTTRYYSIQNQSIIGNQNPLVTTTQQFNAVQANLTVSIKPVVSGDEQVTLIIEVEQSDFIGQPPENSPPPSVTSKFSSMIRVRNEEMVVLGGIERSEKSETGSGVPFLSRIPVIKWFFSSKTKSKSKTLTTLFIKPTILY